VAATEAEVAGPSGEEWRARAPRQPLWRRVLPFVMAIALLAFVVARLDLVAFREALSKLNVVPFLGFAAIWTVSLLAVDTVATVVCYRVSAPDVKFGPFYLIRGASYVPGLLNYHLGQAFLTYMISRAWQVPIARAAGATLLGYASWMGCLLLLGGVAMPLSGRPAGFLFGVIAVGLLYLVVLHLRPARLVKIGFLSPLFEAGIKGHLVALAARVPHLFTLVLGLWVPFFFFDVAIPVGQALLLIPLVLVATTLPLTPQGFGTRDALCLAFFSAYASGTNDAERAAQIAACTTTWGITQTLATALIGLVCTRWATKLVTPGPAASATVTSTT
jgi:hypothetical protein